MFIKVEIKSKESTVYKLENAEVLVGSGPSAVIHIGNPYISKRHIKLIPEGSVWYAVDQGSTNGSYQGDEKFIPGKGYKLELGMSIRLSDYVFLTLLSDAENFLELPEPSSELDRSSSVEEKRSDQDKTQIISLDDLKQAKAIADKKRKEELVLKQRLEKKERVIDAEKLFKVCILAAFVITGGYFGTKMWIKKLKASKKETVVRRLQESLKARTEIDAELENYRIPRSMIVSRNKIITQLMGPKCNQVDSFEICATKPKLKFKSNGLRINDLNYFFYLEESLLINRQKNLSESKLDNDTSRVLAFYDFIVNELFDQSLPNDANVYVAFYRYNDSQVPVLTNVGALKFSNLPVFLENIKKENLSQETEKLKLIFSKLEIYYTYY